MAKLDAVSDTALTKADSQDGRSRVASLVLRLAVMAVIAGFTVLAISMALELGARPENEGKMIIAIIPSFAERYLSTPLFTGLG